MRIAEFIRNIGGRIVNGVANLYDRSTIRCRLKLTASSTPYQ